MTLENIAIDPFCNLSCVGRKETTGKENTSSQVAFEKVGECLYSNPTCGTYYAIIKVQGKKIRRSRRAWK